MSTWTNVVKDLSAVVAVLIGGAWALWNYVLRRERYPKIQFDVDIKILGKHFGYYVVELNADIKNIGYVRHKIKEFTFELRYLPQDVEVKEGEKGINYQIIFPEKASILPIANESNHRSWIKMYGNDDYTFIDPGVTQKYTYVTKLPEEAAYALLKAEFKYSDISSERHTAQKAIKVTSTS